MDHYRVAQPLLLGGLIRYFDNRHVMSFASGVMCASGIVIIAVVHIFVYHPFNFNCRRISLRAKTASCTLIFRKVGLSFGSGGKLFPEYASWEYNHFHVLRNVIIFFQWFNIILRKSVLIYSILVYMQSDSLLLHYVVFSFSQKFHRCSVPTS